MPEPLDTKSDPKHEAGSRKLPMLAVVPPAAIIGMANAMRYGAFDAPNRVTGLPGYGPFNWRDKKINANTYIDAAMRHLLTWWDGEDLAPDSKVHHIDHAMATLGILKDAITRGMLNDNRPTKGEASRLIAEAQRE